MSTTPDLNDPLGILFHCGGYYNAPPGGPLVGYAGRYEADEGVMKQYVGRVYFNVAAIEQRSQFLQSVAIMLAERLRQQFPGAGVDQLIAAPMGGILLAGFTAYVMNLRVGFLETRVTALATETAREQSKLVLARHEIASGAKVVLVEDVCNNFSTTGKAKGVIEAAGGCLVGIACFLNRSAQAEWEGLPVVSLVEKPTEQYRQEDDDVRADIEAGNVVWKPKADWSRLMEAMRLAGHG